MGTKESLIVLIKIVCLNILLEHVYIAQMNGVNVKNFAQRNPRSQRGRKFETDERIGEERTDMKPRKVKKPIHKLDGERSPSIFSTTLCGAFSGLYSGVWRDITCKRCLKRKP